MTTILKTIFSDTCPYIARPNMEAYQHVQIYAANAIGAEYLPADAEYSFEIASTVAKKMHATGWNIARKAMAIHYKIPISLDLIASQNQTTMIVKTEIPPKELSFIELRLFLFDTADTMRWNQFYTSYEDLCNILINIIEPFGLAMTANGLCLQLMDERPEDPELTLLMLTNDPSEVLKTLGLSFELWKDGFDNPTELFEFVSRCKMFWLRKGENNSAIMVGDGWQRHNAKWLQRHPIFRQWCENYIPSCALSDRFCEPQTTRFEVLQQVLEKYQKLEVYGIEMKKLKLKEHWTLLWRKVTKAVIPKQTSNRSVGLSVLKRALLSGEGFDGLPVPQRNTEGRFSESEVRQFISSNWRRASEIGVQKSGMGRSPSPSKGVFPPLGS